MRGTGDTPVDLQARLDAERRGLPFVVFRDATGSQQLVTLDPDRDELTVGRAEECAIRIEGDLEVSRLHALLVRRGGTWTAEDSGLSRNGTFVCGDRLHGHRVLRTRDVIRAGTTEIRYFDPAPERTRTVTARRAPTAPAISPAQRKVLVALCTPYRHRSPFARARSNEEIARELFLSEETVRTHLRTLFVIFGITDAPQSEKRVRLAEEALLRGVVRDRDLGD